MNFWLCLVVDGAASYFGKKVKVKVGVLRPI